MDRLSLTVSWEYFADDWDLLGGDKDLSQFPRTPPQPPQPPGVVHISTINSITRSISHSNDISNFTPILSFTTTWLVPLILSAWQLSLLGSGTTNASDALWLVEHVYAKRYTSISR